MILKNMFRVERGWLSNLSSLTTFLAIKKYYLCSMLCVLSTSADPEIINYLEYIQYNTLLFTVYSTRLFTVYNTPLFCLSLRSDFER